MKKKKAEAPPKKKYAYRDGFNSKVPAQVAGERIAAIQDRNGGHITPKQVVDDARPEGTPLHPHFEWDPEIAAEKYRVDVQAKSLVTGIRVMAVNEETHREIKQPENVHVNHETAGSGYVTVAMAFADEDMRDQVLQEAKRAYLALMQRYKHLKELADLHAAIIDHLVE
jgi:hypothetical protein